MEKVAKLINWHISNDKQLHGNVANHPKLPDGMYIHTTPVQKFDVQDNSILAKTKNTLYVLPFAYCDTEHFDSITVFVKENIGIEVTEKICAAVEHQKQQKNVMLAEISTKLENNQWYLAISTNSNYYFDFGLCKDDSGTTRSIEKYVHVGTFQDSVILRDTQCECFDLRYFPYSGCKLEFYTPLYFQESKQVDDNELIGYIKNTGDMDISVMFTWGTGIVLKSNEERAIYNGMRGELKNSLDFSACGELYPAVIINSTQDKPIKF